MFGWQLVQDVRTHDDYLRGQQFRSHINNNCEDELMQRYPMGPGSREARAFLAGCLGQPEPDLPRTWSRD
jgi:hypothetical protein